MRCSFEWNRTALIFLAAVSWTAVDAGAQAANQENAKQEVASTPITIGKAFKIQSKHTGETHEINVWVPPSKDDKKTYPVLYLIDGGLDQDFLHIAGLAQLATINNRHEVPIVVGIRTSDRFKQLTPPMTDTRYLSWNDGTGGADSFRRMIQEDIRPFIEKTYPHDGRRILLGESLAGFFVMREFLRYPDGFTHYISVSPSLWLDDRRLAKEAGQLLSKHNDTSRKLYVTMADEGGTMQDGLDRVLAAIKKASRKTLKTIYVDRRKTDRHSTIYHGAVLDAMTQLFGIPVAEYGRTPWYLREGGKPEDDEPKK